MTGARALGSARARITGPSHYNQAASYKFSMSLDSYRPTVLLREKLVVAHTKSVSNFSLGRSRYDICRVCILVKIVLWICVRPEPFFPHPFQEILLLLGRKMATKKISPNDKTECFVIITPLA